MLVKRIIKTRLTSRGGRRVCKGRRLRQPRGELLGGRIRGWRSGGTEFQPAPQPRLHFHRDASCKPTFHCRWVAFVRLKSTNPTRVSRDLRKGLHRATCPGFGGAVLNRAQVEFRCLVTRVQRLISRENFRSENINLYFLQIYQSQI